MSLDTIRVKAISVISFAGSLCLGFLVCIILADVSLRAIDPAWRIFGVLDMVELSLDWLFFLAIPLAIFQQKVISVDLIDAIDRRRMFALLGSICTLAILVSMATQVVRPGLDTLEWGETTLDLGLPKIHYWIAIWVGIALSCVGALFNVIDWFRIK